LRVLFQNRYDALEGHGGDTVQMYETRDALAKLGVDVEINLEQEPDVTGYDLVHIFNIQRADYSLAQLLNAKKHGKPVVVSTIYWDMRHILALDDHFRYIPFPEIKLLSRIHKALPRLYFNARTYPCRRRIARNARRMLSEADLLLPNSYSELEIIALIFNLPSVRGKAVVVPNGIRVESDAKDSDFEHGMLRDLPPEYVLEVGTYYPVKGQLALVKALMAVPDIPLVFIGPDHDGPYGQDCQRLGMKRGNTYCLGFIPHRCLAGFYERAKVHALPSLRESPGLTTLEAAASGANCVVSFHGPIAEYFGDDVWVCDPLDLGSVRQAVVEAWHAPRSGRLKEHVLADFTWERAAQLTLQAYERVLGTAASHWIPEPPADRGGK